MKRPRTQLQPVDTTVLTEEAQLRIERDRLRRRRKPGPVEPNPKTIH